MKFNFVKIEQGGRRGKTNLKNKLLIDESLGDVRIEIWTFDES
jgi:hypothetical protein